MTSASLNGNAFIKLKSRLFSAAAPLNATVRQTSKMLDRKTLRAIRNLPQHMLNDIGIPEGYTDAASDAELTWRCD